ncbi:proteasome subunit beta type-6-like [Hordeum vulgare subsp. vulgare]|uniref:proteasome subunit beta type-6-like n=1 Tax=Hordeum vulgare subsp. vulgare TaxID=112509 RepID=UPI001D1A57A8|nr:proteasome subunit beta type-6-like [Hordeum vulgare subsp. vulgare]
MDASSSLMGGPASADAPTDGEHRMGTTIVGVCYDGGVVLAADSRTSTGMYVENRASDKITQLTDNVYVCRSGSVSAYVYAQDWAHSHVVSTCYCDIQLFE